MELKFNNIKEFAEHKKINKAIYQNMSYLEKRELKNNLYDIMEEKDWQKDLIWEYLNEPMDSEEFVRISILLSAYGRKK